MFAAVVLLAPSGVRGQDQSDLFVDPPAYLKVSTLGKLLKPRVARQSGDGLESIVGEQTEVPSVNSPQDDVYEPLPSIPADAEYGPVGGFSGRSGQERGTGSGAGIGEVGSSLELPNTYRGDVFFPKGTFDNDSQGASSRRQPRSIVQRNPASLSEPFIGRDKLIDIERASGEASGREIIRERYQDGSVKIVRSVAQDEAGNYFNDGGYILYDRSQTPIAAGSFSQGKLDGEWQRIYKVGSGGLFSQSPYNLFSGPYKSTATFRQGKLEGTWQLTDREGRLMATINYAAGVRQGPAVWNFPSGRKMQQARFEGGLPDGFVQRWDRQGKLQSRQEFVDGRRVIRQRSTFPNQTIASETTFLGKRIEVMGRDNWWAAKPAVFEESGEKVQHGLVREWYPNRQPKLSGQFNNGQREGVFTWWHENGNRKAEGKFENGQRVGVWRYWYASGMKRSDGSFVEDQPKGIWRSWDQSGKLTSEKDVEVQPEPVQTIEPPTEKDAGNAQPENGGNGEGKNDDPVIDTDVWNFGEKSPASVIDTRADALELPAIGEGPDQADGTDGFNIELENVEGERVPRDPGSLFGGR